MGRIIGKNLNQSKSNENKIIIKESLINNNMKNLKQKKKEFIMLCIYNNNKYLLYKNISKYI